MTVREHLAFARTIRRVGAEAEIAPARKGDGDEKNQGEEIRDDQSHRADNNSQHRQHD